jgi:hypothetical protein
MQEIRKMIMEIYRVDVEAIKNLSNIAAQIAEKGKFSGSNKSKCCW